MLSNIAIDSFLNELVLSGVGEKVVLIIDADRQDIYSGAKTTSYFALMRQSLISKASELDIRVLDMEQIFTEHYKKHGVRFEFSSDGHWNSTAHNLAASAYLDLHVH